MRNNLALDNTVVIGNIYDAALAPQQWASVLKNVAELTGSSSGVLLTGSPEQQSEGLYAGYNIEQKWVEAYNRYYHRLDPSIALFSTNPGAILFDHVTDPDRNSLNGEHQEFYREYMLPQSHYHTMGCALTLDDGANNAIILHRNRHQGPYQEQDIQVIHMVREHICRALQINRGMQLADNIRYSMEAIMARLQTGMVIVDLKGNPVFFNKESERLAANSGAFYINSCCVGASHKDDDVKLKALIKEAAGYFAGTTRLAGGNIDLRNIDKHPVVNVVVVPLNPELNQPGLEQPQGAIALLITPLQQHDSAMEHILNLYNLTRAEKRLCHKLLTGSSLSEVSGQLHVSKNTLRSQLRSIFAKTGTSRQSELIHFLLRLGGYG